MGNRSALTLPVLVLLALLASWLTWRGFQDPLPTEAIAGAERPRYHLEGTQWQRYDDTGAPVFEASAAAIEYFDDASMALRDIDFRTRGSEGSWALQAPAGEVPAGERRLLLQRVVDVRGEPHGQPPVTIRTASLWVDWSSRTLSTSDPVVARAPGRALQAVGMRAGWAGQRVQFLDRVEVRHAPQ